jgi:hypothetical protein
MWGTKKKRGKGQQSRKHQCKSTKKVTLSAKNIEQKLGESEGCVDGARKVGRRWITAVAAAGREDKAGGR